MLARGVIATSGWKPLDLAVMGVYFFALLAVGAYCARRERTTGDYFLGGRRVPWWAAGISIFGTGLSVITFMAIPAVAFHRDWQYLPAALVQVLVVPFVVWFYIPAYRRLDITTPYAYLQRRFHVLARWLAGAFYIFFQFGRIALLLYLPALALTTVTGLNMYGCILVVGLLATAYTVLGGIEAVIWTDVIQSVVLIGGAVLCMVLAIGSVEGGIGEIVRIGMEQDKFRTFTWSWDVTRTSTWVLVIGYFFATVMPNTADAAVVQRYLVTPDERSAKRAAWTGALVGIPMHFVFYMLGTALFVFYATHPDIPGPTAEMRGDVIVPFFVVQQLPAGLSGLVLAGLVAASMSSADSSINAIAATVTADFLPKAASNDSVGASLFRARVISVAVGAVGVALALLTGWLRIDSALDAFIGILSVFGGALAGLFVLGLFIRRVNSIGALCGAASSAGVTMTLKYATDVSHFLYAVVGLVVCVLVGWGTSFLGPTPSPQQQANTYRGLMNSKEESY